MKQVTVNCMMMAREQRVLRQQRLLSESKNCVLVCFTMNIAGPTKNDPCIRKGFLQGKEMIFDALCLHDIPIIKHEEYNEYTGNELYLLLKCSAIKVKTIMVCLEDSEFGRLLDIDVLDASGQKISRTDIGLPVRNCIVCGKTGGVCARSRAHSAEEVFSISKQILRTHNNELLAKKISVLATQALMDEVCVTPKPGLVDRSNSGSHNDMDIFTFCASAASLEPFFFKCAMRGLIADSEDKLTVFQDLRFEGQRALRDMLNATKGINTHKGALFLLGTLCAAAGYALGTGEVLSAEGIAQLAGTMSAADICRDLSEISNGKLSANTNGMKIYCEYGVPGVRGEIAAGLPSVQKVSLPRLRYCLANGLSFNDSCAITLCYLIASVEDTAFISRAGYNNWLVACSEMRDFLDNHEYPSLDSISEIDKYYISKHFSPGGSADLLAATIFLFNCESYFFM